MYFICFNRNKYVYCSLAIVCAIWLNISIGIDCSAHLNTIYGLKWSICVWYAKSWLVQLFIHCMICNENQCTHFIASAFQIGFYVFRHWNLKTVDYLRFTYACMAHNTFYDPISCNLWVWCRPALCLCKIIMHFTWKFVMFRLTKCWRACETHIARAHKCVSVSVEMIFFCSAVLYHFIFNDKIQQVMCSHLHATKIAVEKCHYFILLKVADTKSKAKWI